jgi:hypothetical protein
MVFEPLQRSIPAFRHSCSGSSKQGPIPLNKSFVKLSVVIVRAAPVVRHFGSLRSVAAASIHAARCAGRWATRVIPRCHFVHGL